MSTTGLFTRMSVEDASRKVGRARRDPVFAAELAGPSAVEKMNPSAAHPNLEPRGKDVDVLFLYSSVPANVDKLGSWKKRLEWDGFSEHCKSRCGLDAVCRTLPPSGRAPNVVEIAAYRKEVLANLVASGARVVVAVGNVAFRWFFPQHSHGIDAYRGVPLPYISDAWSGWVVPVLGHQKADSIHRAFALAETAQSYGDAQKARALKFAAQREAELYNSIIKSDIGQVDDLVSKKIPNERERFRKAWENRKHITTVDALDSFDTRKFKRLIGLDVETTGGRPFTRGGVRPRLRSIAISDGRTTVAVPFEPTRTGDPKWVASVRKFIKKVVRKRDVVVHNLNHDLEWLLMTIDDGIVERAKTWLCTMVGEWQIDQRVQRSLAFVCQKYLGADFKNVTGEGHDSWRTTDVDKLLAYNAADAIAHVMAAKRQHVALKEAGVYESYLYRVGRDPALVRTQIRGVPISQRAVCGLSKFYDAEIKKIQKKIKKLDCVRAFKREFGAPFDPGKKEHLYKMFKVILDHDVSPKSQFDKKWLAVMVLVEPVAALIRDYRVATKAKSTYVDRFIKSHPKTYVYDDDRLHCQFSQIGTDTGRLACRDPNNQNWPSRGEGKRVRKSIRARRGHVMLAFDYGQIEARVMGMASDDVAFCKALRENYDIHAEWAARLRELSPGLLTRRRLTEDQHRKAVKNEFVFPIIYGASPKSMATPSQVSVDVMQQLADEFWERFPSLRRWQKDTLKFYERNNYVSTLTGFRRYGPLGYNQILNTPFQGTAADFAIEALRVLSDLAIKLKKPWLQPCINIHDDLTFEVPVRKVKSSIKIIVKAMLNMVVKRFKFINVPLTSDCTRGKNLFNTKKIGEFSSDGLR